MFEERVMDYILEMAKVTDKEVTVKPLAQKQKNVPSL